MRFEENHPMLPSRPGHDFGGSAALLLLTGNWMGLIFCLARRRKKSTPEGNADQKKK
jgi:hypothetical protein